MTTNNDVEQTKENPIEAKDAQAEIAKKAHKEGATLKQAALALNYLTEAEFDEWVDPGKMIGR